MRIHIILTGTLFWAGLTFATPIYDMLYPEVNLNTIERVFRQRQNLGGLFGGDTDHEPLAPAGIQGTGDAIPFTLRPTATNVDPDVIGPLDGEKPLTETKTKIPMFSLPYRPFTITKHSIIGTPAPISSASQTTSSTTSSSLTGATPASTPSSPTPAATTGLAGVSTEWKVLGIAVVTISGLGIAVLSVVFFDHWWRFLQDVLCCRNRRKDDGFEDFILDKDSLENQLKDEDAGSQRYPSMENLTAPPEAVLRRPSINNRQIGARRQIPWESEIGDEAWSKSPEHDARRMSPNYPVFTNTPLYRPHTAVKVDDIYHYDCAPSARTSHPSDGHTPIQ